MRRVIGSRFGRQENDRVSDGQTGRMERAKLRSGTDEQRKVKVIPLKRDGRGVITPQRIELAAVRRCVGA